MAPKLYMTDLSPPVRAVLLTAKALGITLECKEIHLIEAETLTTEFLKIHTQHTVPTLEDNGYVVWDSHAIIAYLVGKYGTDAFLYPKDLQQRAVIDERLHFDAEILNTAIRNIIKPMLFDNYKSIPHDQVEAVNEAYRYVENFLENDWIAGEHITIADFSLIPTMTSLDILIPINKTKYPKTIAWLKQAQLWPFYNEANQLGLKHFREFFENLKV